MRARDAFTLIELLVVVTIIGLLIALLLPAIHSARAAARKTECASAMRQVGIAFQNYVTAHNGRFPEVFGHDEHDVPQRSPLVRDASDHDDHHDDDGHSREESWLHLLAPYMEHVDNVRICPEDPNADERLHDSETSFALNGYLGVVVEPERGRGKRLRTVARDGVKKLRQVKSTSKTIALFETTDQVHLDHVHSYDWFSQDNINSQRVFSAVATEVAVDRHGPAANYLFVDGHVEMIPTEQIDEWCREPFNFAKPQQ